MVLVKSYKVKSCRLYDKQLDRTFTLHIDIRTGAHREPTRARHTGARWVDTSPSVTLSPSSNPSRPHPFTFAPSSSLSALVSPAEAHRHHHR